MGLNDVPIIDLGPYFEGGREGKASVARQVGEALEHIGFFVITRHRIPSALLRETAEVTRRFFDLPLAAKMAIRNDAPGSPRGYIPYGQETLSYTYGGASPPDLKEGFGMGPETIPDRFRDPQGALPPYFSPNIWPAQPADFRPTITRFYGAMERLTIDMLHVFATALRLEENFFDAKFEGHNSTLRLINYPEPEGAPREGQLRAGAHTDYGALTILMVENVPGGLQVRTRGGDWIDVVAPPDSFVINIGDLMMNWTNDFWLSNLHRVANPPRERSGATRRQTIAYFSNPNENTLIQCIETCRSADNPPRHPPILAGEHRLNKIRVSVEPAARAR